MRGVSRHQGKRRPPGAGVDEIGLRRSLKFLRDSVTDPGAYIDRQYRSATVGREGWNEGQGRCAERG